jgi:hypothetical protein
MNEQSPTGALDPLGSGRDNAAPLSASRRWSQSCRCLQFLLHSQKGGIFTNAAVVNGIHSGYIDPAWRNA